MPVLLLLEIPSGFIALAVIKNLFIAGSILFALWCFYRFICLKRARVELMAEIAKKEGVDPAVVNGIMTGCK